jgi:hypothetical protein
MVVVRAVPMNRQALWSDWIAKNPTNNMMIRKVQREAFFAGCDAMNDHIQAGERIYSEMEVEDFRGLTLVKDDE